MTKQAEMESYYKELMSTILAACAETGAEIRIVQPQ